MKPFYRILPSLVLLALVGCVTTDYVGKTYAPTAQVDLYLSDGDVTRPYEVMGELRVEGDNSLFLKSEKLQKKLLKTAREKGADGVIVGPVAIRQAGATEETTEETRRDRGRSQSSSSTTVTVQEIKELRGLLIKYKAS